MSFTRDLSISYNKLFSPLQLLEFRTFFVSQLLWFKFNRETIVKIPFILRYIPALYLLIMGALLCGIEGCHVLLDLPRGYGNLNPDSSDFLPKKSLLFRCYKKWLHKSHILECFLDFSFIVKLLVMDCITSKIWPHFVPCHGGFLITTVLKSPKVTLRPKVKMLASVLGSSTAA